ncbi:hypothetical protein [Streptomyces sp. PTD5-9]|uniref:hypothetical protein n=1 Tax=Streptomyces sp. PTD5-9 TaxID=3120150 RepID=UPI003FCE0757
MTTVAVSPPLIHRAFGAGTARLSWVSDAFVLPVAALILTAGVFGDVHRRKVCLSGPGLGIAGALVSLCASSVHMSGWDRR